MPGDGVSLPTTLAQLGNVAKTQAKAQQTAPQVTPFSEQSKEGDDLKVQRVPETSEAEKNRVTSDGQEKDKRKRRRLKRRGKEDKKNVENGTDTEETGSDPHGENLGSLIDLHV